MNRLDSIWLKVHCMPAAIQGKLSRVVHFYLMKIKVPRTCILCFYFSVSVVKNVVLAREWEPFVSHSVEHSPGSEWGKRTREI